MLTCPKCVAELTQPIQGDTTTCPGCGLLVHVSSLSPLSPAVESAPALTQTYQADRDESSVKVATIPKRLGRYEILSLLGTGGFSLVYLAKDLQLGRQVALKVMRPERLTERANAKALFEEARLAARLEHPGFIAVYDVAQDEAGTPFLVMPYLPGKSLRDRCAEAPPTFVETAELIRKLATTIHFAHKQRLYHRDLKPSNILFDAAGEPHIADLGLAVTEQSQVKRAGEWAGTLPYMAPEQVRGETHRLDGRCDIWSLGVIMYEMLTGKRPFVGELAQIGDEIQHREPRPLRQLNETIPASLEQICLKCLRKSLHDRYLSAFDLAADLEQWLRSAEGSSALSGCIVPLTVAAATNCSSSAAEFAASAPPTTKRQWAWLVGTSIPLLVLLALGIAYALAGSNRSSPDGGSGSSPTPTVDIPLVTPDADRLVPGRWHNLLERHPQKLVWGQWDTARLNYDERRHSLTIDTPDIALLTVAQTQASDYRLQISAAKSAWVGGIGFFWGYHEAEPQEGRQTPECHILWVRSIDSDGIGALRMERQRWKFRHDPRVSRPLIDSHSMAAESVGPPKLGAEAVLELTVRQDEVVAARWCGQEYPAMGVSETVVPPPPISAAGKFGIVAGRGAVTVTEVRFMLTRE